MLASPDGEVYFPFSRDQYKENYIILYRLAIDCSLLKETTIWTKTIKEHYNDVIYFQFRIHKHSVITEGLGTVSSTVLFGLSASPYGYVRFWHEYATNYHSQSLDNGML